MLGRKAGDRTFKAVVVFVLFERRPWIALRHGFGGTCAFAVVGEKGHEAVEPTPPAAQVIDGAPDRDRVHPGRKLGFAAKPPEVPPNGQPYLLADIPGRVFVAHDRLHESKHRLVLAAHEDAERVLFARLGALHDFPFGFG
jgi:hypothetical protein